MYGWIGAEIILHNCLYRCVISGKAKSLGKPSYPHRQALSTLRGAMKVPRPSRLGSYRQQYTEGLTAGPSRATSFVARICCQETVISHDKNRRMYGVSIVM